MDKVKEFKGKFAVAKMQHEAMELYFSQLTKDSPLEMYEVYISMMEKQYALYSDMVGLLMLAGLTEDFYEQLCVILAAMESLEQIIFESKRTLLE